MRGGERCLEVVCELFPDAPLFTLLHVPGTVSPVIERRRVVTSFVQRLPAAAVHYRRYLPLFPAAVRRFDLSRYDLVLSLSHCVAKGVPGEVEAPHRGGRSEEHTSELQSPLEPGCRLLLEKKTHARRSGTG